MITTKFLSNIGRIFIASFLVIGLGACEDDTDDCIDESLVNPEAIIPYVYNPVCGCNDVTYSNEYEAEAAGVTSWTSGVCDGDETCENGEMAQVVLSDNMVLVQMADAMQFAPNSTPNDYELQPGQQISIEYTLLVANIYPPMIDITCLDILGQSDCTPIHQVFNDDFLPADPITINNAVISDDCLEIEVSHSGGCEDHEYELVKIPIFCGTPPVPPTMLQLRHNANNDACEALITTTLSFDLSTIQVEGASSVNFELTSNGDTSFMQSFNYTY